MHQEINQDILNFFRFSAHGQDMHQKPTEAMPEALYNALAYAQVNPDVFHPEAYVNTPEWQIATQEYVAEIVGNNHFTFSGLSFGVL